MRRREFITLLGGAAAAWPLATRAQPAMPTIGYLSNRSADAEVKLAAAFRESLQENGYVVGRNVAIEWRWGEGEHDRLPTLAAELVRRQVAVIVATDTNAALAANREIGGAIPLVFLSGRDPVEDGLVASLPRPGGKTTGVAVFTTELAPKRLEILREFVPAASVIAFLVPAESATAALQIRNVLAAAQAIGQHIRILHVDNEADLASAFEALRSGNVGAVLYGASTLYQVWRDRLVALAARHKLPAMYEWPDFVTAGGLVSYSPDRAAVFRQAGIYTARILSGEKPADLPVMQPIKFELVINLKTARALGLEIPPTLLARADEVIE